MGHDENKNDFGGTPTGVNSAPTTPNAAPATPSAAPTSTNAALEELRRISADSNPNAAPTTVTFTDSTTNGDIVLNVPKTNNNRGKLLIIGIVVILLLIVVLVIVLLSTGSKTLFGGNKIENSEFVNYLLNGDGNIPTDEEKSENAKLSEYADGEKLIYPFTFYTVGSVNTLRDERIENYFVNLNEKYEEFKKNNSWIYSEKIERLDILMKMMDNVVNYSKNSYDLADKYIANRNNQDAVTKYFDEKFFESDDETLKEVSDNYRAYYEKKLATVMVYDSVGCYRKEKSTFECVLYSGNNDAIDQADKSIYEERAAFRGVNDSAYTLNREIIKVLLDIGE